MEHQHQYTEINSGKNKGNMKFKDVMCADCGRMKRLNEDGKMSVMKKGKRSMQAEEKGENIPDKESGE